MALTNMVLIGHANGNVHSMQVMDSQDSSQMATQESLEIGKLTNAGFRTIVAAAWYREETKTAGLLYAAAWDENQVDVLLRHGDRIASSHEFYAEWITRPNEPLNSTELLGFCHHLKIA